MTELDQHYLSTDNTLNVVGPEGRPAQYVPYRIGGVSRRDQLPPQRSHPGSASVSGTPSTSGTPRPANGTPVAIPPTPNGTAVSMPLQVKPISATMPPPNGVRVPSSGPPHPPSTPALPISTPSVPSQAALVNGVTESPSIPSHSETEVKLTTPVKMNGVAQSHSDGSSQLQVVTDVRASPAPTSVSPNRPKSQNQQPAIPVSRNFQFPVNGYPTHLTAASSYVHPGIRATGLSATQQLQAMQAMKGPFAAMTVPHDMSAQMNAAAQHSRPTGTFIPLPNGGTYEAQLQAARQMQWQQQQQQQYNAQHQQAAHMQRASLMGMVDANGNDASMAAMLSPPLPSNSPTRVPSSNGPRPVSLKQGMPSPALMSPVQGRASPANAHIARLTPHGHSSPHLVSPSLAAAQAQASPSRQPQATLPSPSLQARQAVGPTGAVGY